MYHAGSLRRVFLASYRILLFLHIASVIALGATFAYPFIQSFAERQGAGVTRFALQAIKRTNTFFVYPAMALIFIFGLALLFSDQRDYKDDMPVWLMISIVWYVAAVGIAVSILRRDTDAGISALEGAPDNGPLPEAYAPYQKRMQMFGGIVGLSIIGIALLMVLGREGAF